MKIYDNRWLMASVAKEMKNSFTDDQIIESTKNHILEIYSDYAYPVVPIDEWGNPERYEPGCVPWISCQEITVKSVEIDTDTRTQTECEVIVIVDWAWNREEKDEPEEETDVELALTVAVEDGQLVFGEPERVN